MISRKGFPLSGPESRTSRASSLSFEHCSPCLSSHARLLWYRAVSSVGSQKPGALFRALELGQRGRPSKTWRGVPAKQPPTFLSKRPHDDSNCNRKNQALYMVITLVLQTRSLGQRGCHPRVTPALVVLNSNPGHGPRALSHRVLCCPLHRRTWENVPKRSSNKPLGKPRSAHRDGASGQRPQRAALWLPLGPAQLSKARHFLGWSDWV